MEYYEVGLSSQKLRDQAQRREKMQDRKGRSYATILDLKAQGIQWMDRKV